MHGILFDIKRFAVHDGPGLRTSVFFKGCPLHCLWCHNPEGMNPETETMRILQRVDGQVISTNRSSGRIWTIGELTDEIFRDQAFYAESGGGVTFSGGEPLQQPEFLMAVLKQCAEHSVHTCLDTCGYGSSGILQGLMPYVHLFLYDLKIMDAKKHKEMTGVDNQIILDNLSMLHRNGAQVMIRFPLIPGVNDDADNIRGMMDFLKPLERFRRIDILPYHALAKSKYKKLRRDCPFEAGENDAKERAVAVRGQLEEAGFDAGIGG